MSYDLTRTLMTSLRAFRAVRAPLDAELRVPLWIWPTDVDWLGLGHVNNGWYLTLMDQGRLDHFLRTGLTERFRRHACRALVAETQVRYRREVRAFDRCALITQLVRWDERRIHYVQRIERGGELCVRAEVAMALRGADRTLRPVEVLGKSAETPTVSAA
jgi:acyl-CoA thioesterase FadM